MTETRGQLGEYTSSERQKGLFPVRAISQALHQLCMYLHVASPEFGAACSFADALNLHSLTERDVLEVALRFSSFSRAVLPSFRTNASFEYKVRFIDAVGDLRDRITSTLIISLLPEEFLQLFWETVIVILSEMRDQMAHERGSDIEPVSRGVAGGVSLNQR
jgi:hypothetical protein